MIEASVTISCSDIPDASSSVFLASVHSDLYWPIMVVMTVSRLIPFANLYVSGNRYPSIVGPSRLKRSGSIGSCKAIVISSSVSWVTSDSIGAICQTLSHSGMVIAVVSTNPREILRNASRVELEVCIL